MTGIRNTTEDMRDPGNIELFLAEALITGDNSAGILRMEADGQRQLVNSDKLPSRFNSGTREEFEAVGFTFGEVVSGDPLFRDATLPAGWAREGSDHAMWSYLVDEHGRRRVSIFYKAAFYDRDAFMNLETQCAYLRGFVWGEDKSATPILDDTWLTAEAAVAELEKIAVRVDVDAVEADQWARRDNNPYWTERAAEHRARAARARELAAAIGGAA